MTLSIRPARSPCARPSPTSPDQEASPRHRGRPVRRGLSRNAEAGPPAERRPRRCNAACANRPWRYLVQQVREASSRRCRASRRLSELFLLDPARTHTRLNDDGVDIVGGEIKAVERAGHANPLVAPVLDITQEVVAGATGEVLGGLDAILAESHQHGGR